MDGLVPLAFLGAMREPLEAHKYRLSYSSLNRMGGAPDWSNSRWGWLSHLSHNQVGGGGQIEPRPKAFLGATK